MRQQALVHPTDADLLAYVDGEIANIHAARIDQHIGRCVRCRDTLILFRNGSAAVETLLGEATDTPASRTVRAPRLAIVPRDVARPWFRRPSLRAAIILVGVGAATLTVTPVRGWVVDFIRSITGSDTSPTVQAPSVQPPPVPPVPALRNASSVSFVPGVGEFTIQLSTQPAGGRLIVSAVAGSEATGWITNRAVDDALLVTATGFAVRNGEGSTASYTFGVPASVTTVVVQIGDREALRSTHTQLLRSGPVEIDLARQEP